MAAIFLGETSQRCDFTKPVLTVFFISFDLSMIMSYRMSPCIFVCLFVANKNSFHLDSKRSPSSENVKKIFVLGGDYGFLFK